MSQKVNEEHVAQLASAGYYISLRIGFAVPVEEINALPPDWVSHYTENRYMMFDPVVHWVYGNVGSIRWSELSENDPRKILGQAKSFGMPYGVAISVFDGNKQGQRSYGTFARSDREFDELEIKVLQAYLSRRHKEMAPPHEFDRCRAGGARYGAARNAAKGNCIRFGCKRRRDQAAAKKCQAETGRQNGITGSIFGVSIRVDLTRKAQLR